MLKNKELVINLILVLEFFVLVLYDIIYFSGIFSFLFVIIYFIGIGYCCIVVEIFFFFV